MAHFTWSVEQPIREVRVLCVELKEAAGKLNSHGIRFDSHGVRINSYGIRVTSHVVRVNSHRVRVSSHGVRINSHIWKVRHIALAEARNGFCIYEKSEAKNAIGWIERRQTSLIRNRKT